MVVTNRKLSVLVIVTALLLAATGLLYTMRSAPPWRFRSGELLIQGVDVGKVAKITVRAGGKQTTLQRAGEGFTVDERNGCPASTKRVNDLLLSVLEVRCISQVTASAQAQSHMSVADDEKTPSVELADAEGKKLVKLLASRGAPDSPEQHVRLAGSDAVYEAGNPLWLSGDPVTYIERRLLDFSREDIAAVIVQAKDFSYSIARDKDGRIQLQGIPPGKQVKQTTVEGVFVAVESISCDDVAPAGQTEVQWDATYICQLKTPLTYIVRGGAKGEDRYIALSAEGPPAATVERSRTISDTEAQSSLEKKDAVISADAKAKAFNSRHANWVYKVPAWKGKDLSRPLMELVETPPPATQPAQTQPAQSRPTATMPATAPSAS